MLLENYIRDIEKLSHELSGMMEHFREEQKRKIGKTITLLREAKNWGIEDLAKALSIKKSELSQIEQGGKIISSEIMKKCGEILEVNLFTPEFFYS